MSKQKQFLSMDDAAKALGRNRATVYNRMKILKIKARKFEGSKKAFLSTEDIERLRMLDTNPSGAGAQEKTEQLDKEVA